MVGTIFAVLGCGVALVLFVFGLWLPAGAFVVRKTKSRTWEYRYYWLAAGLVGFTFFCLGWLAVNGVLRPVWAFAGLIDEFLQKVSVRKVAARYRSWLQNLIGERVPPAGFTTTHDGRGFVLVPTR